MTRHKFYNRNPLGKREKDCVCRAISLGVNRDYYDILDKLYNIADLFDCEALCVDCYKHLLDKVFNLQRIECYHGCPIYEFLDEHSYGIYIIRIEGHLTCAIDGCIYDLWDCSDEIIDIVWEVI